MITRYGTVLRLDGRVVDDEDCQAALHTGHERRRFRVYTATAADGPWLFLVAAIGTARGWVQADHVIPIERTADYYTAQIRADPAAPDSYVNRGLIYAEQGDYARAIADYDEALRLDPKHATASNDRGWARHKSGDHAGAIADFTRAIELDPKYVLAYSNRGLARAATDDLDGAIADFTRAIELDPKFAWAFDNRATAWYRQGAYDRVLADYEQAARLDPAFVWAHNNRAWLWATCPDPAYRDGPRAVVEATRACELGKWHDAYHLGTLAAAHAEAGDFAAAITRQQQALALLPAASPDRAAFEERLALYQSGSPYHEPPPAADPAPDDAPAPSATLAAMP